MKKNSLIAIVGTPNVGKSTLFNRILGTSVSIVDETPGVTRDRIYGDTTWLTKQFTLIDTGGLTSKKEIFSEDIRIQAEFAINEANAIIFMLTPKNFASSDNQIIKNILYKSKKPVILVVNKIDITKKTNENFSEYDLYSFGFNEPILISAEHGLNINKLLDKIIFKISHIKSDPQDEIINKLVIIGKPNVGKSSLMNAFVNQQRSIVSNTPHTTTDTVLSDFKIKDKDFKIIDTAGIRRRGKIVVKIEKYSVLKTQLAIKEADIIILLLDLNEDLSNQDANVAGLGFEIDKPIIIVGNKLDLIKDKLQNNQTKIINQIKNFFPFLHHCEICLISAFNRTKVDKLKKLIYTIHENANFKVKVSVLNEIIHKLQLINPPSVHNHGKLKIYYGLQLERSIPTFVLFVNKIEYIHFSYKRYIKNQIRINFDFKGVPIKIIFRKKNKE